MFFLYLSLACTVYDADPEWVRVETTDDGTACLQAPVADAAATVTVLADACLSSSCDRNEQGSCTATLDGDRIMVTSEFSWEEAQPTEGLFCTDDCGSLRVDCTMASLEAGDYVLVHGEQQETVTVPTEGDCDW